jgi:hypothetical protein
MSLVTPDEGQLELCSLMLIDTSLSSYDYVVDLYVNNYQPAQNSTASDFTIASWTGYLAQTFSRSQWNTPTTIADQAVTTPTVNPFSWTPSGGTGAIYGYLVRSSVTGKVLWAEAFATPYTLAGMTNFNLNLSIALYGANP